MNFEISTFHFVSKGILFWFAVENFIRSRFSDESCNPGRFARGQYTSGSDLTVMALVNAEIIPEQARRGVMILSKKGFSPERAVNFCQSIGGEMFKPLNAKDLMAIKQLFSADYEGIELLLTALHCLSKANSIRS